MALAQNSKAKLTPFFNWNLSALRSDKLQCNPDLDRESNLRDKGAAALMQQQHLPMEDNYSKYKKIYIQIHMPTPNPFLLYKYRLIRRFFMFLSEFTNRNFESLIIWYFKCISGPNFSI